MRDGVPLKESNSAGLCFSQGHDELEVPFDLDGASGQNLQHHMPYCKLFRMADVQLELCKPNQCPKIQLAFVHGPVSQIYMLLATSRCVRCIIYGVLGHFCSKASLFTGFWLAWVGKPRFFAHQIVSHIDPARSAAELRSMHYLRRFGQILLQSLAIYRLLASSCCVRCIISAFWVTSAPKARYLQAFG